MWSSFSRTFFRNCISRVLSTRSSPLPPSSSSLSYLSRLSPAKQQSQSLSQFHTTSLIMSSTSSTAASTATNLVDRVGNPPDGYKEVREGKAGVLYKYDPELKTQAVFYNKVQCFNRDLSIMSIRLFIEQWKKEQAAKAAKKAAKQEAARKRAAEAAAAAGTAVPAEDAKMTVTVTPAAGVRILEALSATGLRSIRYFKEIPTCDTDIRSIVVNDFDKNAVEAIRSNVEYNGLPLDRVIPNLGDANAVMFQNRGLKDRFQVVDLDPYGTAAPFLDPAIQCVDEGGLLLVTCTDKAVLCGSSAEACYAKYSSYSLKGKYCHEMAVRIVLACIAQQAARHKRYIVPMLSLSIDFYVRVFVRVYTSPQRVKDVASNLSYVFQCVQCDSHFIQPLAYHVPHKGHKKHFAGHGPVVGTECPDCNGRMRIGGPMWSAKLHDEEYIKLAMKHVADNEDAYATSPRMAGTLELALEENDEKPLMWCIATMAKLLKITTPSMKEVRAALLNGNYTVTQSHTGHGLIKTDAPSSVMWDIMRCYAKEHVPNALQKHEPDTPPHIILSKEPEFKADFTVTSGAIVVRSRAQFLPNPEPDWGPKARAGKRKANGEPKQTQYEKRKENQGFRKKRRQEAAAAETAAAAAAATAEVESATTTSTTSNSSTG
jgi:tRNA (guanine26-N2/guanine27-N2)-dimethyltransferase